MCCLNDATETSDVSLIKHLTGHYRNVLIKVEGVVERDVRKGFNAAAATREIDVEGKWIYEQPANCSSSFTVDTTVKERVR